MIYLAKKYSWRRGKLFPAFCARDITTSYYSKAFDRVWREDQLIRAIDKGLPFAYAQWLRDFLSNRKAKVQINGDRGRQLPLHQGLTQGSVLMPLLFLLYIDDPWRVIPENVEVTMFANDFSFLSSHPNK